MKKIFKNPAILIALILILLVAAFFGAKYVAKPIYVSWRNDKLITQAQELYESKEYETAFTAVRKVLIQSDEIEVWELALKIIQHVPSQVANIPSYLQKLIALDPENPDNYAEFCAIALRVKQAGIAKETFDKYPESARDTKRYHEIGLTLASNMGNPEGSKNHIKELLRIEPENKKYLFSLYVLDLQNEDKSIQNASVNNLFALSEEEAFKLEAYRVLLTHFTILKSSDEALKTIQLLEEVEEKTLRDKLLIAQVYNLFDPDQFSEKWAVIEAYTLSNEVQIIMILDFLIQNAKLDIATEWIQKIPEEYKSNTFVSQKMGQVYYLNQDWDTLQQYLEDFSRANDDGWKDKEFGRFLLLSLASRLQGREMEFGSYWEKTLIAVGNNKENLKSVFTQTIRWGWINEAITVIERTFQIDASDNEVFSILVNYYMKTGKTAKLLDILSKRIEFVPDDKNSINNFAIISLLIKRKMAVAYTYAKANYNSEQDNPYYLTTWAYALASQQRFQEAIELIEQLTKEDFNSPQRAIYIASIYTDSGDLESAKKLLQNSEIIPQILEEKNLLESLRKTLELPKTRD